MDNTKDNKSFPIILDEFEVALEEDFDIMTSVSSREEDMESIRKAAHAYKKRKKSITLRVHESDLEVMRLKACRMGIPYQTYINILIHKDAISRM